MKNKTKSFLSAVWMVAFAAFILTACKPPIDNPGDDSTKYEIHSAAWVSNFGNDIHQFLVVIKDTTLTVKQLDQAQPTFSGEGNLISFSFVSKGITKSLSPVSADYPVAAASDDGVVGTVPSTVAGNSYIIEVNDNEAKQHAITAGNVKFTVNENSYEIEAEITYNGITEKVSCKGSVEFVNMPYSLEDKSLGNQDKTMENASYIVINNGGTTEDGEKMRMIVLDLFNGPDNASATEKLNIDIYTSMQSQSFDGEYNLNFNPQIGDALASIGFNMTYGISVPTYLLFGSDDIYYLVDGSISIKTEGEESTVVFNGKSWTGNNVKVSFKGKMVNKNANQGIPAKTIVPSQRALIVK